MSHRETVFRFPPNLHFQLFIHLFIHSSSYVTLNGSCLSEASAIRGHMSVIFLMSGELRNWRQGTAVQMNSQNMSFPACCSKCYTSNMCWLSEGMRKLTKFWLTKSGKPLSRRGYLSWILISVKSTLLIHWRFSVPSDSTTEDDMRTWYLGATLLSVLSLTPARVRLRVTVEAAFNIRNACSAGPHTEKIMPRK